jgi:hypothetical protein
MPSDDSHYPILRNVKSKEAKVPTEPTQTSEPSETAGPTHTSDPSHTSGPTHTTLPTESAEPSDKIRIPVNVVVNAKTSSSITISWDAIEGAEEYEIEYNEQILRTYHLGIELTGLTPDIEYSIRVRVRVGSNFGGWNQSIKVTTNLVIGIPGNVVVDVKTSTSITLSWEAIEGVDEYEIEYNG